MYFLTWISWNSNLKQKQECWVFDDYIYQFYGFERWGGEEEKRKRKHFKKQQKPNILGKLFANCFHLTE